ncbi:prepilin-type N-terminal cleavage/methylation domain-containing protein [Clostridium pasteurianum DSM 525 = ATCC 6013]|uniref:Prepilin-type N-terminal cleavage/methylation domain-containing protein n=1 Tax=Clostridium pasteurianum DSM 525 = ATCC 6013 TaxID=1262449 RepID=A0A0H3J7R4_CLOPA|nr:prepilin-type N-terminal cleavage/methylation domain-containing protein [Clostridium pasteurianum]AJA47953.1 prepilin-type N-terminal cleavage/methylation domain-containing protein [Clostridium pasteurianum DSM 525 = ATCC 6013]AJA51941.1 prepilin-type N-terminal cleavage/methylation domain-containing protein [Clostridium pasteurianum DSM 525 = ATCC 6013]AOZ75240.1 N-terminal cleavage protein [Clostridium pasteurianum DSM 525 = ATCC 6013]AOZ79035.1 N-terminal cleavage protein [Clostridium pas
MQRLKSKKLGFTLIEVMCALSIFTLIFMTAISIRFSTVKMRVHNEKMEKYIESINGVKNEILSNSSDEEIKSMLNLGEVYIDKNNIDIESIRDKKITEVITTLPSYEKPYMKISLSRDNLIAVNLELYADILRKEESIVCKFYKFIEVK